MISLTIHAPVALQYSLNTDYSGPYCLHDRYLWKGHVASSGILQTPNPQHYTEKRPEL